MEKDQNAGFKKDYYNKNDSSGLFTEDTNTEKIENPGCDDSRQSFEKTTDEIHHGIGKKWVLTVPVFIILILGIRLFLDTNRLFSDIRNLISILSFIIWGFAIAYFLDPLVSFFMRKVFHKLNKARRSLSMLLAYLIFFGIIVFLSIFILPAVGQNISDTASRIPYFLDRLQIMWDNTEARLSGDTAINQYIISLGVSIKDSIADFFISENLSLWLKNISTDILNTAWGATRVLVDFILALVLSIYMLGDKDNMLRGVKRFIYALFSNETADKMVLSGRKTNEIFKKFLLGKGAASIIVAVISFLFTSILKMPVPLLQATIMGITNMIPTIGPVIGAVPCLLLTLFYSPVKAFWLLIYVIVIQQIDGMYLSPKILSDSMGLKPFFVIVGVLLGSSIAGLVGAFLGAPTMAVISYFITSYTDRKLKEKNMSI